MSPARLPRRAAGPLAALTAALAACALLTTPLRAAAPAGPATSLQLVPADAAFYSAMLRNKEQADLVANSRACASLWALPSVQQGWKAAQGEYQNPNGNLAALRQFMQADENKELVAMLGDAVSDEVFSYGDETWSDFYDLYQEAYAAMQVQPAIAQLEHKAGDLSPSDLQARAVLSALAKNPDRIKVPDLVVGFKVSDAPRAEKQIKRLEALAQAMAQQFPNLKGKVKRAKVGDASFLTLTVQGSDIPWDNVPLKNIEDKPGEFAPVIQKLKGLTLTVSLGVQHGYLLLGVGASADHLARLGGSGAHLDGQPEFKPLAKFADKKLTSIGYVSKAFARTVSGGSLRQLDSAVQLAKAALAKADLSDDERKALVKNLNAFSAAVEAKQPDAGAEMSFTFLTDRGFEGYGYNYGKHGEVDGSKPLTLLSHLGGAPLLAAVGRTKVSVEGYEQAVKAIQEAFPQLDKLASEKLTGQDKERYEKAKEDFLPLLKRLDEATDKQLFPALADGQFGFVLDAKWTSKRWFKEMPEMETAMPAPEVGIVLGVSDAAALRKAMAEYRAVANEALAKIKAWPDADKAVGDFHVPPPKSEKVKAGTLYWYPLPEDLGLDPQVQPTAGLSKDTAALTLSHGHAERLLASHPLKIEAGPLADKDRPLAGAAILDWAGIVDAATPWVEYGVTQALKAQAGAAPPAGASDAVMSQVRTVLDVLKCFRGATSATYLEDGVLVTHHESVFRDLDK